MTPMTHTTNWTEKHLLDEIEELSTEMKKLETTVHNQEKEIDDMADHICDLREIIRELEEELKEEKQNNDPKAKEELFKDKLQDALDSFQYDANEHVKELRLLIAAP